MGIGVLFSIPAAFSVIARAVGAWYPPFLMFTTVVGMVVIYGLWTMKKWGVQLYVGMTLLSQCVLFMMGQWSIFALIFPAIFVAIVASQYNKMS